MLVHQRVFIRFLRHMLKSLGSGSQALALDHQVAWLRGHFPENCFRYTGWGPQDSVQLPYKWLNSMVYGRYNYNYS